MGGDRVFEVEATPVPAGGGGTSVAVAYSEATRTARLEEELAGNRRDLDVESRARSGELNRTNEFLEGLLVSLGLGVVVVDAQHRVPLWNDRAEEQWGVRRGEAFDQPLLGLDIGLPVGRLAAALRDALGGRSGDAHASLPAVNRPG